MVTQDKNLRVYSPYGLCSPLNLPSPIHLTSRYAFRSEDVEEGRETRPTTPDKERRSSERWMGSVSLLLTSLLHLSHHLRAAGTAEGTDGRSERPSGVTRRPAVTEAG